MIAGTPLALLPIELLPDILEHLRFDFLSLARLCLVSRAFCAAAQPLLWSWIRLRDVRLVSRVRELDCGQRGPDSRDQVITLLAGSKHLCAQLRKLEVRAWPLASGGLDELEEAAITVLEQATSLQTLHWTRKGSLSDRLLDAIRRCPGVRELEMGGSSSSWTPELLLDVRSPLTALSLILPDRPVLALVPEIIARLPLLRDLSILCLNATQFVAKDAHALSLAVTARPMRSLALTGLSRITDDGIYNLLSSMRDLRHLALEACNVTPTLWTRLAARNLLPHLRGLRTTHPGARHEAAALFWPSIEALVEASIELDSLCVYASGQAVGSNGKRSWTVLPGSLSVALANRRGRPLRRLEIHSILCPLAVLEDIGSVPSLEDLTIHLYEKDMVRACLLSDVSNFSASPSPHSPPSSADCTSCARCISSHSGPTSRLTRFSRWWPGVHAPSLIGKREGESRTAARRIYSRSACEIGALAVPLAGTRSGPPTDSVWTVTRTPLDDAPWTSHDAPPVRLALERYALPIWPEALLVVRT